MVYAIFKASYNDVGSQDVVGGICGTAFFVQEDTALTANHILSTANFGPNPGYARCRYWLLSRDGLQVIPIAKESLVDHQEIDTTIVSLKRKDEGPVSVLDLSEHPATIGESVYCKGYVATIGQSDPRPKVSPRWERDKLVIHPPFDLQAVISDRSGNVTSINLCTLTSKDVNLKNKMVLKLSFGGVQGMSGGPLIRASSGEVVGLMSFGLPEDKPQKTNLFAISVEEIASVLRR